MPKLYAGANDIEKFLMFLQGSLRWMKTICMIRPEYNNDQVIKLKGDLVVKLVDYNILLLQRS